MSAATIVSKYIKQVLELVQTELAAKQIAVGDIKIEENASTAVIGVMQVLTKHQRFKITLGYYPSDETLIELEPRVACLIGHEWQKVEGHFDHIVRLKLNKVNEQSVEFIRQDCANLVQYLSTCSYQ